MTIVPSELPIRPAGSAFRFELEGEIGILWFDLQGEKINKFSSWVIASLSEELTRIAARADVRKLLITSAKPDIFIAGADVTEFSTVTSAAQAEQFVRFGQQVFSQLRRMPQITVAVIDGACMGGGTELALNCDYRLISDNPKAKMGLPEVKLGILPAWTGTTRLPRLVGIPAALDMILTGKTLDGRRARKAGLVDEVIPAPILLEAAKSFAAKQIGKRQEGHGRSHFYLEGNPLARRLVFSKARQSVLEKTRGHYPAALKAIDVMEEGYRHGIEAGLAAEAREASILVIGSTSRNLVRLFFMMEDARRGDRSVSLPIHHVGVLGAGVMGGGIAQAIADSSEMTVRMKDVRWEALAGGLKTAARVWKKKVERRRMSRSEMARKLAKITTTTGWAGFANVDVVIEAVVEDLSVKRSVLYEFEQRSKADAIFASNTSTLPITAIAAESKRPENVVGMHFFNPVEKMPLLEVIVGERTSATAVATVAALGRKIGKTVVICRDSPGFIVNRVLAPYMNEAAFLLQEGFSILTIDEAMLEFGMPMGPMALLDEVGIDVAAKAGHVLAEAFGSRMTPSRVMSVLLDDKRLGRKNGRGMYVWSDDKRIRPDASAYSLLGLGEGKEGDPFVLAERMVLAMINEASLVLEEGVAGSPADVDLSMILGTGFPPFRGGPLRYADALGIANVVGKLSDLENRVGTRFRPSDPLRRMAAEDRTFYEKAAQT